MRPETRLQLRELDRALLALASERARLLGEDPAAEGAEPGQALEDLLRRYGGPLTAEGVRELFAALERACRGARSEGRSP